MGAGNARSREHVFAETDGQVYLVRDRGVWRFPRPSEPLPFPTRGSARMALGAETVVRVKPVLDDHPEAWHNRDELFGMPDVDPLVTHAIYMTMGRLVAEVVVPRRGGVLMEHAARGFSKGHWNLPGGFLEFGEDPREAARRETEEELGVAVEVGELLDTYVSGFPGKPAFTYGFVYLASLGSTAFRLKADEVDAAEWFPAWEALERTRNPFARWAIVEAYRRGVLRRLEVRRHRPRRAARPSGAPVVFLDRDALLVRGGAGGRPSRPAFARGAGAALAALGEAGHRIAVMADAMGAGARRSHDRILRELERSGARVEEIYVCPHPPEDGCACRRPRAGLLLEACRDLGVRPGDAWVVGGARDVLAGRSIGARTALLGSARRRGRDAGRAGEAPPDLELAGLPSFARALGRSRGGAAK